MKRKFYVFWGSVGYASHPIVLDICDADLFFLNTDSKIEYLKKSFPFPSNVVFTEIELDDFIPMIKLEMIFPNLETE